ncbi:MAG: hypothetical protein KAS72_10010 [Phycisphaerales bacterium]|nr:hypothetical protein [Phycisphaerales bacterium]
MTSHVETSLPVEHVTRALIETHGEPLRGRITQGVERIARQWRDDDGDGDAFARFCEEHFVADPADRTRLLDRFETMLHTVEGHLYEIRRNLRRWSDLRGDEFPGIDDMMAKFDPAPDLSDQFYHQKLAFVALLNFDRPDLAEMLDHGPDWSIDQWAQARIGKAFGPRIPGQVNDRVRELEHRANMWVAEFHVPVGTMIDEDGKTWFDKDRKLLAHWLIREEIKAGYNDSAGLPMQRALMWVMSRQIDGTIPRAIMNGDCKAKWDPKRNTLDGQPTDDLVGPERYERWLDMMTVAKELDVYHVEHPSAIARKFELAREIPEEDVERLLVDLLSAPVRKDLALFLTARLGRPLEAHDIYFDEILQGKPADEMNELVRAMFADEKQFQAKLPEVLRGLGYSDADAEFLGTRVRVEIAKGAGHAMRPGVPQYGAWLRTNRLDDQLGWDGFDTAMHELGHTIEQLISTHFVPRPALRNVPNTACTEAFAFLYQSLAKRVLGIEAGNNEPDPFDVDTVQTALAACQIGGPSLVELYVWRWLYKNPDSDAASLRDQVITIADDVWDRFYVEHFGPDPYHILAAYQHMIAYPLYLPDYTIGHIISHQIRSYMRGKDLAAETKRICSTGRLTPDLWMKKAVGIGISAAPLLEDTAAALGRLQAH